MCGAKVSFFLLFFAFVIAIANTADAHRPHDDIQHLTYISLSDKETVSLAVVRNNLFRSTEINEPWARVSEGLTYSFQITALIAVHSTLDTVFLSTLKNGVFRSTDGGLSWTEANEGLADLNSVLLASGPSGVVVAASAMGEISTYYPDSELWHRGPVLDDKPTAAVFLSSDRILVGTAGGTLFVLNQGDTTPEFLWSAPKNLTITTLAVASSLDGQNTILVGTDGAGIFRSTDDAQNFEQVPGPVASEQITDLAATVRPGQSPLVVATSWKNVFVSDDGGQMFTASEKGLYRSSQAETPRYLSPHFRSVSIVEHDEMEPTIAVAGYGGLFLSSDLGATWNEANTLPANTVMAFAISGANSDGDHAIAIASYGAGVAISQDEGATWTIAKKGLSDMRIRDVKFSHDYWNDGVILTAVKGAVLYSKSPDFIWHSISLRNKGFVSWCLSIVRPPIENMMRSSEWFSKVMNKYAPRPKTELTIHPSIVSVTDQGRVYVGTGHNGLFRANQYDDGYSRVKDSCDSEISALAVIPSNRGMDRIYSGSAPFLEPAQPGTEPVLERSNNDGESWVVLDITPPLSGRLRMQAAQTANGDFVATGSFSGLRLSPDGGSTWVLPDTPEPVRIGVVSEIALSPDFATDGTILVSIKGQGLFRSTDAGKTFAPVGMALGAQGINLSHLDSFPASSSAICFSPEFAKNKVVFGTNGQEIFRSNDCGETWKRLPFPDLDLVHR